MLSDFAEQAAKQLKATLRRDALVDRSAPMAVYARVLQKNEFPDVYMGALPKEESLARNVQRTRKRNRQEPIPRSKSFPAFPPDISKLVVYDSGPESASKRIVVFSDEVHLRALRSSKLIFADGAFKTRPVIYEKGQVYGIHGQVGLFSYPCLLFALLPNKQEVTYRRLLRIVKRLPEFREAGDPWAPEQIIIDFEKAAANAFQKFFPGARISGCYFHFKQVSAISKVH